MSLDDYNDLQTILNELRGACKNLEVQIEEQLGAIREAEAHLWAIENIEPADKKIFSPRKVEILYKEEIGKIREEKECHEIQKRELCDKKAVLDRWALKIGKIVEKQEKEFSAYTEIVQKNHRISLEILEELTDRIEKNGSAIERNPIQVRQDYLIIAKALRETVEQLRIEWKV